MPTSLGGTRLRAVAAPGQSWWQRFLGEACATAAPGGSRWRRTTGPPRRRPAEGARWPPTPRRRPWRWRPLRSLYYHTSDGDLIGSRPRGETEKANAHPFFWIFLLSTSWIDHENMCFSSSLCSHIWYLVAVSSLSRSSSSLLPLQRNARSFVDCEDKPIWFSSLRWWFKGSEHQWEPSEVLSKIWVGSECQELSGWSMQSIVPGRFGSLLGRIIECGWW